MEFLSVRRASAPFHRPWDPTPPPGFDPYSPEAFAEYLASARGPRTYRLLVCERETRAIVGAVHVSEVVRGVFQSAYLGYWIAAERAGQGFMTEGLSLAVRHAFGPLGLHRLEANIQPNNTPSIALVKRLGFELEGYSPRYLKIRGRWRDHERWALLAERWRGRKRRAR